MRGLPTVIVAGLHSTALLPLARAMDVVQSEATVSLNVSATRPYFDEMSNWPVQLPPVEREKKWRGFTGAAADLNKSERAKRQKRARAITRKHR